MAYGKRKKDVQTITLSSDVREMLRVRSQACGISMSAYIERLILKDIWESPHILNSEQEGAKDSDISKCEMFKQPYDLK